MTWHKGGPGARRGYHHGNLREALIAAALDLISKKGPAGFTFADAARAAGVSPAAPYRHFRDRDALMADVARRGFEGFADALTARLGRRQAEPTHRVRARRARLPRVRAQGAGAVLRHVRVGHLGRRLSGSARGGRPRLRRAARGVRGGVRDAAQGAPAAGADDGAAHLELEPRHRGAVCARGRRAPHDPDDAGGAAWKPPCSSTSTASACRRTRLPKSHYPRP